MTQLTGFTTNYTDPSSGQNLPQAWVNLSSVLYRPYTYVFLVVDIYSNYEAFEQNKAPVFSNLQKQINVSSPDWITYFDPDTMDQALHNIQKQSIAWLQEYINTLLR